jgi:hypothetical protein
LQGNGKIGKLEKNNLIPKNRKNGKLPKNWLGQNLDTTLPLKIVKNVE